MTAKYSSDVQKLYVGYFGGPTAVGTQTVAELLRNASVTPVVTLKPNYGPDAKQARRDQIRRNGGKR